VSALFGSVWTITAWNVLNVFSSNDAGTKPFQEKLNMNIHLFFGHLAWSSVKFCFFFSTLCVCVLCFGYLQSVYVRVLMFILMQAYY